MAADSNRVGRRTLCLACLAVRSFVEMEQLESTEGAEERQLLLNLIDELELGNEIEVAELNVLQQPYGTLSRQAKVNCTWRSEGLGVLVWALQLFELPAYDALVDPAMLFQVTGVLDTECAREFLSSLALRSPEELRRFQQQTFALHWRLREFSLNHKAMDFRSFARDCSFGPLDISLARIADGDLAIGETPISKTSEESFRTTLSIVQERHQAINWLMDGGELYSETDTST